MYLTLIDSYMKNRDNPLVRRMRKNLRMAEEAMENGELATAFERIENILKKINAGEYPGEEVKADYIHNVFLLDLKGRCLFLQQKLIKEMAKKL